ncbi:hypothetical protein SCLCIDRAFT_20655 [Scleroderma citrinum Foug A]|uniref:RING-type domain-containing protein n=1 Tax=Scleroderma citrinum Foug A TaxID=1036808 RepID=A0A0C3EJ62_9AGAM|nr:hypothetical protein SCLCIDRAFT_20655 [Scleroderma citrinum Foug A]
MDEIQVECPIHLDSVSLKHILAFKCGHGFCTTCLDAHFAHRSSGIVCPTCRKPVKRKDAFPLFLSPARFASQSRPPSSPPPIPTSRPGSPAAGIDLTSCDDEASSINSRLRERNIALTCEIGSLVTRLRRAEEAEENIQRFHEVYVDAHQRLERDNSTLRRKCNGLQEERDCLRHENVQLRGDYASLKELCTKKEEFSARLSDEKERLKEDLVKVKVELQKASTAKNQAVEEAREERRRVGEFQSHCEKLKKKVASERKKWQVLENENKELRRAPTVEDESLIVIDANQSDHLAQNDPDCSWLDNARALEGDRLDNIDEGTNSEPDKREGEDSVSSGLARERKVTWREIENVDDRERSLPADRGNPPKKPLVRFFSDWGLEPDVEQSSKKRKHTRDNQPMGSKLCKVKLKTRSENGSSRRQPLNASVHSSDKRSELPFPLPVDGDGRVKGTVVLGSRRKLNSRN